MPESQGSAKSPNTLLPPSMPGPNCWLRGEKRSQNVFLNLSFLSGKGEVQIGFLGAPGVRGFLLQVAGLTLQVTYLSPVHKELQLIRNLGWARHGPGEFGLLARISATEVNRKD